MCCPFWYQRLGSILLMYDTRMLASFPRPSVQIKLPRQLIPSALAVLALIARAAAKKIMKAALKRFIFADRSMTEFDISLREEAPDLLQLQKNSLKSSRAENWNGRSAMEMRSSTVNKALVEMKLQYCSSSRHA
uniref:Uncharacterized protein n=1 Tax=Physcomitrium patens TaxID=3218 RepID=A0A2K1IJP9_PHYPA|nr:hypothetical protein PHYPA_028198 [Physcomitrium patens]